MAFLFVLVLGGCSPVLEEGDLVRLRLHSGDRITYAVLLPEAAIGSQELTMIMALPTGFEEISDCIQDMNNFWRVLVHRHQVGVVIPSSDTSGVFRRTKYAGFDFGAEEFVGPVMEDVERRYKLTNPWWVAADIGGNGRRLVNVLREGGGGFRRGYLVTSFSFHPEFIEEAGSLDVDLSVVIGDRDMNIGEEQLAKSSPSNISIDRTHLQSMSRVDQTRLGALMAEYADYLAQEAIELQQKGVRP